MDVAFPAKKVHMGRSLVEKMTIYFLTIIHLDKESD